MNTKLKPVFLAWCFGAVSFAYGAPTRIAAPKISQECASFHYLTGISRTDFRNAGQTTLLKTYTITSGGTYAFVQDVPSVCASGNLSGEGQLTAIFVNSNDVVVDLGGKTLSYAGSSDGIHGIEVANSKANVVIKNGNIIDFTGNAVKVNESCQDIRLQELTISGTKGIFFAGATSGQEVKNSIIENCMVSKITGSPSSFDAVGLQLDLSYNIFVSNSIFERSVFGVDSDSNVSYGCLLQSCTNVIFENCDASGNRGDSGYGFYLKRQSGAATDCFSCIFIDCTANGNYGTATTGTGSGFGLQNSNACVLENCLASDNNGGTYGLGFTLSTANYCELRQCIALNNHSRYSANSAAEGGLGFHLASGGNNILDHCVSSGSQSVGGASGSFGTGFYLTSESYDFLNTCQAYANGSTSHPALGAGIYLASATECVVHGCKTYNNVSSTSGAGYGIYDTAANSSTLVMNCESFGNKSSDSTYKNYSVAFTDEGESLDLVPAGGDSLVGDLGDITTIKPMQNLQVKAHQ